MDTKINSGWNKWVRPIWIFILISLWVINLVMYTVAPEYALFNKAILGSAIGLTLLFIFVYKKAILEVIKKPYNRSFFQASLTTFLVLIILVLLNQVSMKLRLGKDFTKDGLHTLSQQSKILLKNLEAPIKVQLFAKREDWIKYMELLGQYEMESSNFQLDMMDIETNPTLVAQKDIKENGTAIVTYLGREISGVIRNELDVTNLILDAQRKDRLKIYYTTGHKELDAFSKESEGAKYFYDQLSKSNYELMPIDLLKVAEIPTEADLLIVLAPKSGFLEKELSSLESYQKRGGNFLFFLQPLFLDEDINDFLKFVEKVGVKFENKLALDRLATMQGLDASIPVITNYQAHSITKDFSSRTLFPLSSSLIPLKKENLEVFPLVQTSAFPASWAESDLANINKGKVFFNNDQDTKGPINLMIGSVHKDYNSKAVVVASPGMISNAYKSQSPNFNLILNAVAWLTDDEGIISLNRPGLTKEVIILSASELSLIFYFSILFLPFIFFGIGIWNYRKRVNK